MERFLSSLERRYGRYAPGNLTYILVAIQAFVFVLNLVRPGFTDILALDADKVMHGQVWRLVTYLAIPPSDSPVWVIFALYWLYTMGTALEAEWGAFRYAFYWLVGMVGTTVFAFGLHIPATNAYLLMSLFLAFATLWPEYRLMVLFIIPVPVKWLALLDGAALLFMVGTLDGFTRVLPLIAVANYLLFFLPTLVAVLRSGALQASRARALRRFKPEEEDLRVPARRCASCGVTNADPKIEFRVCSCEKCGGRPTEFCLDHARNH